MNSFFYLIPSEYDVIFPTSTQTIFDAPPGYVSLYIHSFSLANLKLPLTDFFCKIAFRNFIYTKDDDDLGFLPKEPSPRFGIGSPSASVNTEIPKDVKEHEASYQVTLLTLESKVDSLKAEKARLEAVEVSFCREVEELKQDRRDVVSKVIPYAAMELVAATKEPFDLPKAKGYRSSYKKEHTQASNDFATVTFPWLDEFVANSAAPIEALLSKKPPTLQEPAPSWTQMHAPSQKATPSFAPSSNPMSPPANLVKPSPSTFE
ncbi:hypothetical protein Tco_1354854 [Tanacetum coccineum]